MKYKPYDKLDKIQCRLKLLMSEMSIYERKKSFTLKRIQHLYLHFTPYYILVYLMAVDPENTILYAELMTRKY